MTVRNRMRFWIATQEFKNIGCVGCRVMPPCTFNISAQVSFRIEIMQGFIQEIGNISVITLGGAGFLIPGAWMPVVILRPRNELRESLYLVAGHQ